MEVSKWREVALYLILMSRKDSEEVEYSEVKETMWELLRELRKEFKELIPWGQSMKMSSMYLFQRRGLRG